MMSQHNVGDTQKLKLPEPSHAPAFDQAGSGYINVMDSTRLLSPGAPSSGQQSTTNIRSGKDENGEKQNDGSNCSFAEKLYAAVADGATNGGGGEADGNDEDGDDAQQEQREEEQQKEELGEMLNLLHEGSIQSGSTSRSPELGLSTPSSPQTGQAMAMKAQRSRHMSKKQREVMDIINQFQIKVKKPALHVYWLFDDGGKLF